MADLVVGSRGSRLALRQTEDVIRSLRRLHPQLGCSVRVIRTRGDDASDVPVHSVGVQGIFVKEIEQALLRGEIDFAVHSAKDVPSRMDSALCIAAYPPRLNPSDALVSKYGTLCDLPAGCRIGTSSPRRRVQLLAARPDVEVVPIRGNLDTRLRKLEDGQFDAVAVAWAGMERLGLEPRITDTLSWEICTPAAGQGALAVQCRKDSAYADFLRSLDEPAARCCVEAERYLLARLNVGCQAPFGAVAHCDGAKLRLIAFAADVEGRSILRVDVVGDPAFPHAVAENAAVQLIDSGVQNLLESVQQDGSERTGRSRE